MTVGSDRTMLLLLVMLLVARCAGAADSSLQLRVEKYQHGHLLFPSIHAARDYLREARKATDGDAAALATVVRANGATVTIGPGIYPPLELLPEDSGAADAPVIWKAAANDGSTIISAGVHIPASLFTPWSSHAHILTANIASFNLTFGTIEPVPFPRGCYGNCTMYTKMGLNFQNRKAMLARWPNVDNETGRYRWQFVESQPKTTDSFVVTKPPELVARIVKWSAEPDPWMHLFQKFDWDDSWHNVNIRTSGGAPQLWVADCAVDPVASRGWYWKGHSIILGSRCVTAATPYATAASITLEACNATDPAQQWTVPSGAHNTTIMLLSGTWMWNSVADAAVGRKLQLGQIDADAFKYCDAHQNCNFVLNSITGTITNAAGHCVTSAPSPPDSVATISGTGPMEPIEGQGQAKFMAVNLLCELDAPMEYWVDERRGVLYFYPPIPLSAWGHDESDGVFLTQNLTAAHVRADFTILRGLAIRHSRGNGLLALNVTGLSVENCELSGHGQHGVVITGNESGVSDSMVRSIGCSGIRVSGGVARTLTSGRSFVSGNKIQDVALVKRTYNPGVYWNGVGNNYSHNRVSNSPHVCFLGGGNEGQPFGADNVESGAGSQCIFDSNVLDSCVYECADCGAFYTSGVDGMAWVNRGNVLTNSNFTNIGSVGVYLDDQMSGWHVSNNHLCGAPGARIGFMLGGGRRNRIQSNTLRGFGRAVTMLHVHYQYPQLSARVHELLYPGSPWPVHYPEMLNVTTDHFGLPIHTHIVDNVYDSPVFMQTSATGPTTPKENAANLKAWLSIAANNTKV